MIVRPSRRRDELNELLALADSLKQRCEDYIARREKLRMMQFMSMGLITSILVLAVTIASFSIHYSKSLFELYALVMVCSAFLPAFVGFYFYFARMLRRYRRWFLTDSSALKELVRLLRETEAAMLGTGNWSALDRARFHIQLSRFSIGDEFENDYERLKSRTEDEVHPYRVG
jgi:hypothetical protein